MAHRVTLLSDDEVGRAARRAVEAAGAALAWDGAFERTRVGLGSPAAGGGALAVGVDPCRAREGARTRFPETDLVVVRELGDGVRFADAAGTVDAAVRYARDHERDEVTVIGDGVEADGVGGEPAGGFCGRLVARPEDYDVLVLPAVLGAVVSDLAAGMAGGAGLAPRTAFGDDAAVFGSAPPEAGNPAGLILSGALMLRHLGEAGAADRLEAAVAAVIRRGEKVTADVKPTPNDPSAVGTSEFADAVIEEMN